MVGAIGCARARASLQTLSFTNLLPPLRRFTCHPIH